LLFSLSGANSGIRFEKLREGIVDYEKIRILKEMALASPDKKAKALMNKLDEHLKILTTEHGFNEDTLKMQVYEGQKMIQELSDRLARKDNKFHIMRLKILVGLIICSSTVNSMAQNNNSRVICTQYQDFILTHNLTPDGPVRPYTTKRSISLC